MKRHFQIIFVFLLVITSFSFFGATFLNKSLNNYVTFFSCFFALIISIPYVLQKREGFVLPVQLIVLSIIISIFMSYFSWNQAIKVSIVATVPLVLWIFFFYLLHTKFPIIHIEKIVIIYGIIYLGLYFYQMAHSETILFGTAGGGDEFNTRRGIVRVIFPGAGIFFLAVFVALNKLTTQKEGRWFWAFFVLAGIIIPIMQATRQFIVGVLIVYLFHFTKNINILKKIIVIACFASLLLYIGNSDIPVIKGIREAQAETAEQGKDNIRILAANFFLNDFSPNNISKILGNGVPAAATLSVYGKYVSSLYEEGFYMEDVGIIGLYVMFGILAIIGYIMIWFKSFILQTPEQNYYVKYYLWFLLVTSVTSDSLYHPYYLISTVFVLYIFQTVYIK